jgi:hypothetical protein
MKKRNLAIFGSLTLASGLALAQEAWKSHITWAKGNHTSTPGECNCVEQYVATEPACIIGGGRACLTARAIDSARHGNYAYAYRLMLITQCHNGGARDQLAAAGERAIGDFLRTQ